MTDLSAEFKALADYRPTHKLRFVTAASLFDGHDASINIMRRILMGMGAEVIHLGHNRSVDEVVTAALQEDAQGIAVSSYQGGHVEYFKYMVDLLRERGGADVQVFGGGGGVIVPAEIRELADAGVRIFSPEDGQRMGLAGMIGEMLMRSDRDLSREGVPASLDALQGHTGSSWRALARLITALESGSADAPLVKALHDAAASRKVPVLGVTGTGGAGKSSLTDELVRRLRLDQDDALHIAVISIDPSRRKSGGALLGDRIRMNAIGPWAQGVRLPAGPSQGQSAPSGGSAAPTGASVGARLPAGPSQGQSAPSGAAQPLQGQAWGPASTCARWPRAKPAARSAPRCPTSSPRARRRASISSSSRRRASARATRRSCRWSTCRCT